MDVTSALSATTTTPATPVAGGTALSADFQTFLRMLTAQMQNQDPLNPLESTDFAVQLATFSGVEQQVRGNQLLESLSAQFSVVGMAQLAGWVGQEARAAAPVWFSGDPVTLHPNPLAASDEVVLVVRDADGDLVTRTDLPVSADPFVWTGLDASGQPLPEGRYNVSVESRREGEVLSDDRVEYYGQVIEARSGAGGVRLVLEGGIEVLASSVTGLRAPPDV